MSILSVVIPTYRRPVELRRCLTSLTAQHYRRERFEVIVVDDGSEPPVDPALASDFGALLDIHLIRSRHGGPARARRLGIAAARGEILAFLDDDCTVPPEYLAHVDRLFRTHPDTVVVQVALENPDPDNLYGRAWAFALRATLRANTERQPDGRMTSHLLGGTPVVQRDVFTRVGFDPAFADAREDADLRLQLRRAGIPIHYEPAVVVYHHGRATLRAYLVQHFRYGRGEFHLRRKWGPDPAGDLRYPRLTSADTLRTLVAEAGVRRGLAVYALFWLKGRTGLLGLLSETDATARPGLPTWLHAIRVAGRWVEWEVRRLGTRLRAALGHRVGGRGCGTPLRHDRAS